MTNQLIGRTLSAIWIAKDKQAIRFDTTDGEQIIAKCYGDCCSHTWIEHVEGAGDVLGSPVLIAEDVPMPEQVYDKEQYECIAFYGFKIGTEKGEMLIDYRNESNGYYGGNLSWPRKDDFYGGVHGQNVLKEEWEKLT